MNSATYVASDTFSRQNRHASAKQRIEDTIRNFENRLEDKIKAVFTSVSLRHNTDDV
jgi:predicted component of type VI protein secretion system